MIVSCGGGGTSSSIDPIIKSTSFNEPPKTSISGKVIYNGNIGADTSNSNPSNPRIQIIKNNISSKNNKTIKPSAYSSIADNSHKKSYLSNVVKPSSNNYANNDLMKYLCYEVLDDELNLNNKSLTTIIKDIDTDNDGEADINISYEGNEDELVVYKNISIESFKFDEIPTDEDIISLGYNSLSELFTPDYFRFDLYKDLEQNVDINNDGEADQNLAVDFILNDIKIQDESQIFFNINYQGSDLIINERVNPLLEQPEDISLLNHDVNFDGQADINLDTDGDGMADTYIDSNDDCFYDYSLVDAPGSSVSGAKVEVRQVFDQDNDSYLDTISDQVLTTNTDGDGNFIIDNIQSGQKYILTITKDRGSKLVWDKTVIVIPVDAAGNFDIGTFPLTSAPIVVGIETSLKETDAIGIPMYGKLEVTDTMTTDFEVGKTWFYKIYMEDINNSDIYRIVPYRDDLGQWYYHELMFTSPDISQSGFYEIIYEYELREDGCFNKTLNSYSNLWQQDDGNWLINCNFEQGMSYEQIDGFGDSHYISNSDDINSANDYSSGVDHVHTLFFANSLYNPFIYEYGFQVKSITINEEKYLWDEDETNKSISIYSETDSLILNIKTEIEVFNTSKDLNISYGTSSCNKQVFNSANNQIGNDITFNFEDYCDPKYEYIAEGTFCLLDVIDDGYCRSEPAISVSIEYTPSIKEKPADLAQISINDQELSSYLDENIIEVGDKIKLSAILNDPNNLNNEIRWFFPDSDPYQQTLWMSEDEHIEYVFTVNDIGAEFRIDLAWRNNDGVANDWAYTNSEKTEIDGSTRIRFRVSE